jgi:hypothetical protein
MSYGNHLLVREMKPVHYLGDRSAQFQIIENYGNRGSRITEYACTATLARNTLDGWAL